MTFDDGDSYTVHLKDHDTSDSTFDRPDLSAFTRLDGLGLEVTSSALSQRLAGQSCSSWGA